MVKNPNWQERGRGVEIRATEKQLQQAVRVGLEPGTGSGSQVRRNSPLDHAAFSSLNAP